MNRSRQTVLAHYRRRIRDLRWAIRTASQR